MSIFQDENPRPSDKTDFTACNDDRLQMSSGRTTPLPRVVNLTNLSEYEQFSAITENQADSRLKRLIVWPLVVCFFLTAFFVDVFIVFAYFNDITLLKLHLISPDQRIITSGVVKTLIGATVVQVGAAIVYVYHHFFKN